MSIVVLYRFLIILIGVLFGYAHAKLGVSVSPDNELHYRLQTGAVDLMSAPIFITVNGKRYSTSDGSLRLQQNHSEMGMDYRLGKWHALRLSYRPVNVKLRFDAILRYYDDYPDMILFGQSFPDGVTGCSVNNSEVVSTSFPSFQMKDSKRPMGYLSYGGIMFGDTKKKIGRLNQKEADINTGLEGGPLVVFDEGSRAVVMSAFSQFMAASIWHDKDTSTVNWGIMGSILSIPAGYEYWTIMYTSVWGINQAMKDWGSVMRRQYNKQQSFRQSDFTNNYLGYWTDRGAYYYYQTEPNKTYEQTILDVKAYADSVNLPYRYIELDSWWYYKGPADGVAEWIAMPHIFPHGMQYLWNKTGWPVLAHNRWWSSITKYAKQNGGKYNFILEKSNGIPDDAQFWDDLMKNSSKWGHITYMQDWMNVQFDQMEITRNDIEMGRTWLKQMGNGAAKNGITIQYCMSPPRHSMQSLEIPVVTQARVSEDYLPGVEQWRIGITSIFAEAMGVAPVKDNFWTTKYQPGNPYRGSEPNPELHAVAATLSTGPVAPCDKIGATNVSLLMRCCNADGLILRPSKPALAIDDQIKETAFGGGIGPSGEVWTTYTDIGYFRYGIILVAALEGSYNIGPTEAFGKNFPESKYYSAGMFSATRTEIFSDNMKIKLAGCTMADFCLIYTTPQISLSSGRQVLLLGELTKWVPMSEGRVARIDVENDDVRVHLAGAVMEKVSFWAEVDGTVRMCTCSIFGDGTAIISVINNTCFHT